MGLVASYQRLNHWRGLYRYGMVVRASLCRLTEVLQSKCSPFAGEFQYRPLHSLVWREDMSRKKEVFVHAYMRYRLGQWERVIAHWRGLPNT